MKRILLAAAAAALFSTSAQGAAILNGGFEAGVNPGSFQTLGVGSTNITDWDITDGTIDYIGTYWQGQGAGGGRSVDLAGNSIGEISQTLEDDNATESGQKYRLTFFVSKNPDGGAPIRQGFVEATGGTALPFTYSAMNSRGNMMWEQREYTFTAGAGLTTVSFRADATSSPPPGTGCCFGPGLDSVSITAVPEPGTWAMMISGFGLVGGLIRRRRSDIAKLARATA